MKTSIINRIYYLLGIIFIILIWIFLSLFTNTYVVPKITVVFKDITVLLSSTNTWVILLYTLFKLIICIIISYIVSLFIAILSYKYNNFREFISPIIALIRSIPVASFVIILLVIIGTKITPMIITMFVIIPLASESIYASLKSINKDIIEETKLISNINFKVIMKILIPMSSRMIVSSILSSFGLALKVLVMSEVITQGSRTIGGEIQLARTLLETPRVFSWTIILIVFILLFEALIKKWEKKIIEKNN